ncbi:uncharacterized protein si:ch211-243a20.4 [Trichomycterus rosablanca]|uniref:uncharacterized protein si:ch211-243a20.4 n=1 Tax=Trichomycterus rosablanca TaxID=2290929 RepID=UPI002F34FACA
MFTIKTEVFGIFLLCCCSSEGSIVLMNRTSVALPKETVQWQIEVEIPANTSASVQCYVNKHQVWISPVIKQSHAPRKVRLVANVTMNSSLDSGEFYFNYMNEVVYGVVLVQDGFFLPEMGVRSFVIPLLAFSVLLMLFSITGSVYIFKLYKEHLPAKVEEDGVKKRKTKNNKAVQEETGTSDSVYTALDSRQVSVYDVLNVDEDRSESRDSQREANASTMEEGIFESVYENLATL